MNGDSTMTQSDFDVANLPKGARARMRVDANPVFAHHILEPIFEINQQPVGLGPEKAYDISIMLEMKFLHQENSDSLTLDDLGAKSYSLLD